MRTNVLTDFPTKFTKRIGIVVVGCGDSGLVKQNEQIPVTACVMVATGA